LEVFFDIGVSLKAALHEFPAVAVPQEQLSKAFRSRPPHKNGDRLSTMNEVRMILLRAAALALLLSLPAQAQDEKKTAVDVVQAELSICVVYYTFVRGCAIEKAEVNVASVANSNAERLRKYAFQAGQTIRMDNEAMIARQKVAVEQQQKLLEGNCENIVKLDEAYGARCKALSDNPQAILDQYLKR
jgi:hypothetical protein